MRIYELNNNRNFQTIIGGNTVDCKKGDILEVVFNHPAGTLFFINENNLIKLNKFYSRKGIENFMAELSILCSSEWCKVENDPFH